MAPVVDHNAVQAQVNLQGLFGVGPQKGRQATPPRGQASPPPAGGCLVTEAAQAALDQQIAIIKASATDIESIFSGANSRISPGPLNGFDLSGMITDPLSLLKSTITNRIKGTIA